jgi:predicted anti-sigma-YlaC factor YlaD
MKEHKKKTIHEICTYLGQDLDHPMCKELIQHLKECPACRFYLDTVKLTVNLFRETHPSKPVPEDLKKKLLNSLHPKK